MGMATININKKDDSTVWGFNRTWIEFHPALDGVVKRIYISENMAKLLLRDDRWSLYEMFKSNSSLLDEYKEVA